MTFQSAGQKADDAAQLAKAATGGDVMTLALAVVKLSEAVAELAYAHGRAS